MWCRDGCAASVDRHRRHAHPRRLPAGTAQARPTGAARLALASAGTCTGIGFLIAPAHFSDDLVRYDSPRWNLLAVLASGAYVYWTAAVLVVVTRLNANAGQGGRGGSRSGEGRPLAGGAGSSQTGPSPLPRLERPPVRQPVAAVVRRTGGPLRRGGLRRASRGRPPRLTSLRTQAGPGAGTVRRYETT